MAIAHIGSPPRGGGDPPAAVGLDLDRGERSLLQLRRGGWISGEQVAGMQHEFLLDAVNEIVAEHGYRGVTVAKVTARARVSRRTLYDQFDDLDACLLAAVRRAHDQIAHAAAVGCARAGGDDPRAAVHGAVVEVLGLLDAQPALARMCVVEGLAGPDGVRVAHHELIDRLARGLRMAAGESLEAISDRAARALVSGAVMMVHERLIDPAAGEEPLSGLADEIAQTLVGPFAERERADVPDRPAVRPVAPARDWATPQPLPDRAVRWRAEVAGEGVRKQILRYLVEHPGACNTELVEHFQIVESTASRRLARLAKDRLIVSRKRSGRHSWHVTARGQEAIADDR